MNSGWIKIYRKIWNNPIVTKDPDHLAVWIYLLTHATHQKYDTLWQGERITLEPGQLITGLKKLSTDTGVEQSKVKRILKLFKSDQQIDQQATNQGSLITMLAWNKYQTIDQQNDQRVTNERPTSDQRVTTIQEYKEYKEQQEQEEGYPGIFSNAVKSGMSVPEYFRMISKGGNK